MEVAYMGDHGFVYMYIDRANKIFLIAWPSNGYVLTQMPYDKLFDNTREMRLSSVYSDEKFMQTIDDTIRSNPLLQQFKMKKVDPSEVRDKIDLSLIKNE